MRSVQAGPDPATDGNAAGHGPVTGYLDTASTAPLHPAAREVLLAALDAGWSDPARLYGSARRARLLLDAAREQVAAVLSVRPDEVGFPASGTLAAQLGVLGALAGRRRAGSHLVSSAVEHSCVLHAAEAHEAAGGSAQLLPVGRTGRVDAEAFAAAVRRPGVAAASLQLANHEVGTLQPVTEAAQACREAGVPLHTDAAQAVGRVPVDVAALGVALLSASAHKWGGPAGVGVLVVRKGTRWRSPLPADARSVLGSTGFDNVPAVAAAAAALAARVGELAAEAPRLAGYVARVRRELPRLVPDVEVVGAPEPAGRLPHIVTFSCLYVDGEALLGELDRAGIAVSSGSSCTSSTVTPSHVLEAMGVLTHGNVRVSFGRESTGGDVDRLLAVLPAAVARLRDAAGTSGL